MKTSTPAKFAPVVPAAKLRISNQKVKKKRATTLEMRATTLEIILAACNKICGMYPGEVYEKFKSLLTYQSDARKLQTSGSEPNRKRYFFRLREEPLTL